MAARLAQLFLEYGFCLFRGHTQIPYVGLFLYKFEYELPLPQALPFTLKSGHSLKISHIQIRRPFCLSSVKEL